MAEEVAVASTVYNLAGDEDRRPNYLQSVIFRSILFRDTKSSLGETITSSQLHGPGISLRSFFRWADDHYGLIGVPTGNLAATLGIDLAILDAEIPPPPGEVVTTTSATVEGADYGKWAEQYLLENFPSEWGTNYTVEMDYLTNEITITLDDEITEYVFTATSYDVNDTYIYAYYTLDITPGQFLFIYPLGSGNPTLDAAVVPIEAYGKFFPIIPMRLDGEFLSESHLPDKYEIAKKAFKKSTGGKYDDVIEQIGLNEAIDDIDYVYTVFGVAINVKENSSKKYIYNFLLKMMESQLNGSGFYTDWLAEQAGATNEATALALWAAGQSNPASVFYKTPPPSDVFVSSFPRPTNTLKVTDGDDFDFRIQWSYISTGGGTGLGQVGAKTGDYWIVHDTDNDSFADDMSGGSNNNPEYKSRIRIFWQRSPTVHEWVRAVGLYHKNYIYKSYSVKHRASRSLSTTPDPEEPDKPTESGFIFPLHYGTFTELPLTDATQMSTACTFLVFNSFEAREIPWWESWIFQVLLIVVVAVVAAVFTGGVGIGVLGANLAVGAGLGFSGLTAAIVGSVVNALAAVVLTSLISMFANAVFGDEIGPIVAAVVSFFLIQGLTTLNTTGTFIINLNDLLRVDNLMMLLEVTGNAYAATVSGDIKAMQVELNEIMFDANQTLDEIKEQYYQEFGYGIGYFSPIMFTSAKRITVEPSSTFLTRTLMTGSDIAELSLSLVTDFPNISLTLPRQV